jgi:hypothetical protein
VPGRRTSPARSSRTQAAANSTVITEVAELRLAIGRTDALLLALGAFLTVFFAYQSTIRGGTVSLGLLVALAAFASATYGYFAFPHVAVALTIPFFALLPAVKVLAAPRLGPAKDGLVLAAAVATIVTTAARRRDAWTGGDSWLLALVLLLLALYVVNLEGSHGIAWLQGVRLVAEPFLLLLAGLALPEPRRTVRWAVVSLVATGCFVAGVGLVQQVLGQWRLVSLGFSFNVQVRTISGRLRSFGTMDDPFAYASFLMLAFAACVFALRRSFLVTTAAVLLLAGTAVAYVRTSALLAFALLALELARRQRIVVAGALASAVVVLAVILLAHTQGTESRTYANASGGAAITLNGRTSAWRTALGSASNWPFGRGVGEVGTAAARAGYKITVSGTDLGQRRSLAIDSGYFATIADVGIVGLVVLLAFFARASALAIFGIQRGSRWGWLALALIIVMTLDAVARASFTGFPTAFIGMLLLGTALAAAAPSPERSPQGM